MDVTGTAANHPPSTTKFWDYESSIDEGKKLDAELKKIYVTKKIITANAELADEMEVKPEEALDGIIQKKVNCAGQELPLLSRPRSRSQLSPRS